MEAKIAHACENTLPLAHGVISVQEVISFDRALVARARIQAVGEIRALLVAHLRASFEGANENYPDIG